MKLIKYFSMWGIVTAVRRCCMKIKQEGSAEHSCKWEQIFLRQLFCCNVFLLILIIFYCFTLYLLLHGLIVKNLKMLQSSLDILRLCYWKVPQPIISFAKSTFGTRLFGYLCITNSPTFPNMLKIQTEVAHKLPNLRQLVHWAFRICSQFFFSLCFKILSH